MNRILPGSSISSRASKIWRHILIPIMTLLLLSPIITSMITGGAASSISVWHFPDPEFPAPSMCDYSNSSSLVDWLVNRIGLAPNWNNGTAELRFPRVLLDVPNSSFPDRGFWGYSLKEFSSDVLDMSIVYENSGRLRDICLMPNNSSLFPTNSSLIATVFEAAEILGLPIVNHTVRLETTIFQYGKENDTVITFSESVQGQRLLGLNFAAFWFDQAERLQQIQFSVYYQIDKPTILTDQAMAIGREVVLELAPTRGLTDLLNETDYGLRMVPVYANGNLDGNGNSSITCDLLLCHEYVAEFNSTGYPLPLHIVVFIDVHNGSVISREIETPPPDSPPSFFQSALLLVIFFSLATIAVAIYAVAKGRKKTNR